MVFAIISLTQNALRALYWTALPCSKALPVGQSPVRTWTGWYLSYESGVFLDECAVQGPASYILDVRQKFGGQFVSSQLCAPVKHLRVLIWPINSYVGCVLELLELARIQNKKFSDLRPNQSSASPKDGSDNRLTMA